MTSANITMAMGMQTKVSMTAKGASDLDSQQSFMSTFSQSMELTKASQGEASPRMGVTARTVVRVSDNRQNFDANNSVNVEKVDASKAETKANSNDASKVEKVESTDKVEEPSKVDDTKDVTEVKKAEEPAEDETLTEEEVKNLAEAVSQIISDIVKILQESLGITSEEVTQSMESIEMVPQDLTSYTSVKELFLSFSGESEDTALLFSEDFSQFSEKVSELFIKFYEEMGISAEKATDMLSQVEGIALNEIFALENIMPDPSLENVGVESELPVLDEIVSDEIKPLSSETNPVEKAPAIEFLDDEDEINLNANLAETQKINPKQETSENSNNSNEFDTKKGLDVDMDSTIPGAEVFADRGVTFVESLNQIALPEGEAVPVPQIITQIVEKAAVMTSNGETTMEMILNPEGLGKIYMQVSQKGDEVTARLMTENDAVKAALETSLQQVKEKLELSGTKVNEIEVSVGTHGFERNLDQNQQREQNEGAYQEQLRSSRRSIHIEQMENLMGLMSEEEQLAARIMKDNGGTLDYQA